MAKLQLQLNGNKGLAPNHYGNSLYLASRPELKYVGSQGQKAEGVYWSERYNGYMSPLPNAYQDVLVIEQDLTNVSDSAIQMAFTDRKDTETSIVFADGDGLYTAQKTPTISGIVDAFNFNDGYSTPVYNREYGFNDIERFEFLNETAIDNTLINLNDEYFFIVSEGLTTDTIIAKTIKKETDGSFKEVDSFQVYNFNPSHLTAKQLDDTHIVVAYAENVDDDGIIQILEISDSYIISSVETYNFEENTLQNVDDMVIVIINETTFDIIYQYISNAGKFKRFTVDESYQITEVSTTSISSNFNNPCGYSIGEDLQVVAYEDTINGSTIETYSANVLGTTITQDSTGVLDSTITTPSSVKIDDTHFITAYAGVGVNGFIKTFSIIDGVFTEIDSLEHDTLNGSFNSLIKIDDTHFALAYAGDGLDGFIKIFEIDGSYNITEISELEHDLNQGSFNSLVKIDDTHLALAYSGLSNHGYIKTFSIDGSYNITEIDSLEHDTTEGTYSSLVKLDDTHLALAYSGVGSDGFIKIFEIDGSYNITQTSSFLHNLAVCLYNSLVKIDDTHLALAYQDNSGTQGTLETFEVSPTYVVTQIDSLIYDTSAGTYNALALYGGNKLILPHTDSGSDGWIRTFTISDTYTLTQNSFLEHDTGASIWNNIVYMGSGEFVLAYSASSGTSLKQFSVGTMFSTLDELIHDTSFSDSSIQRLDDTHFALAYQGVDGDGFIKTFEVDIDGIINELDSYEFDTESCSSTSLCLLDTGYIGLAYSNGDQIVKTFSLDGSYNITEVDSFTYNEDTGGSISMVKVSSNELLIAGLKSNGGELTKLSYLPDYTFSYSQYLLAEDITDVTRSQFAGAISYYYTWGDQIGRASSLANIGKEIDSKDTVYWIQRSNNSQSLDKLRSANPHFINSKNQYLYILDGESIHGINISISGVTEDIDGTFDPDIITFQSGVILMDGVDYNENIYLSMVEGDNNVDLWNLPTDTSTKTNCYVYIWNKISGQQLQANKIELLDCKHVGRGFAMGGNVYFLTINSANVSEIRILNRGSFEVLHEIGPDNEFNIGKQSVTVTEMGAIIATNKGNLFLLDKGNELKKLGTFATDIDEASPALVIYGGGEGHEPSNTSQGLHPVVPHLTITYRNTSNENKIKKFYLRNVGTMLNQYKGFTPTTEQQAWLDLNVPELPLVANQGNVYSLVEFLPKLSTLKECVIYCKPTGIITDGEITEIAKIHLYKNQETTPFFTHSVTDKNASRGYLEFNLDTKYVNAVQLEVEYNTTLPIGENDFTPLTGVLEYAPTNMKK